MLPSSWRVRDCGLFAPDGRRVTLYAQAGRVRPIRAGAQLSNRGNAPGTLGAIVCFADGNPLALSCSHVLACSGYGAKDDPIEQPWSNAAAASDEIGRL